MSKTGKCMIVATVLYFAEAMAAQTGSDAQVLVEPSLVLPVSSIAEQAPRAAEFEVRHELRLQIPAGAGRVRAWFVLPKIDLAQKDYDLNVQSNYAHEFTTDATPGNRYLYLETRDPKDPSLWVIATFRIQRKEIRSGAEAQHTRPLTQQDRESLAQYLRADRHVVIDARIHKLAQEIVGDETNPLRQARQIYDWVLGHVDYWVKDPGRLKASPVGSTEYCLANGTGNCSDFHSLYASLARAVGVPTRIVYGSLFKKELDRVDQDLSYHCWVEIYLPDLGWTPLDVSMADIYLGDFLSNEANERLVQLATPDGYRGAEPQKVDYYFGNLDERRVTWSVGRDLTLVPPQESGPVNAISKAHVEVDGKEFTQWTRKLTYRQIRP